MTWGTQIAAIATPSPVMSRPTQQINDAYRDEITALLKRAKGGAMTTRQVANSLGLPLAVAYKRLYRMRNANRVVTIAVGPNESAIWRLK
jgi:hypothetical protein